MRNNSKIRKQLPGNSVGRMSFVAAFLIASMEIGMGVSSLEAAIVNVDADARIRGDQYGNTNYGTGNLFAKADYLSVSRKFYLAFDVSSLAGSPLSSVELVLTKQFTDANAPLSKVHNLFGIIDNSDWDTGTLPESGITWNNAPKNNTTSSTGFSGQGSTASNASRLLDAETVFEADVQGTEYRFDVTDYVRWALGDNDAVLLFFGVRRAFRKTRTPPGAGRMEEVEQERDARAVKRLANELR